MVVFYWLALGYVVAPVLLGLLCRSLVKHQLMPDFFNRAPARIRALDQKVLLAGAIVVLLVPIGIMAGHKASGGDAPFWLMTVAPLAMYTCTARLFYLRFKPQVIKFSATRLAKWLFALLVFIAVWLSNVYTDSIVLNYTRIAPSDLPASKTGVLAIVTVFVWVTLINVLTLALYCLVAMALSTMTPKKAPAEAVMCLSPAGRSNPQPFGITHSLWWTGLQQHHPAQLGGLHEQKSSLRTVRAQTHRVRILPLERQPVHQQPPRGQLGYERLAIAIPDEEKGYVFKTLKCPNGDAAKAPEKKPQISVPLELDQQAL